MDMYKEIYDLWQKHAKGYFWGDPFDVRFYLTHIVACEYSRNMLDVGCSAGVILHKANAEVKVGVDISIEALKIGKKMNRNLQLIAASADYLPFRDDVFGRIICIHTLDALRKSQQINFINEIKKILAKDGSLLISGMFYGQSFNPNDKGWHHGDWIRSLENYFQVEFYSFDPLGYTILYPLKFVFQLLPNRFEFLPEKILHSSLRKKSHERYGKPYFVKGKLIRK